MQLMSRDSLSPRVTDRVRHLLRPGWARSVLVRRTVSVLLIIAAVAVTVAGHRSAQERSVVVSAHDLLPGHTLAPTDLAVREVPGGVLPAGALRLTADAVGRTPAGRVGAGEILTENRLLSSHLPIALIGRDDARLVPVRLTDESVATLLQEGDVVDVIAASDDAPHADSTVLARNAVVALRVTSAEQRSLTAGRNDARPVLLAMDEESAHKVAATGLDTALAVVLH
ncbi:SAF domain-containing protein [Gordonia sp. CPCC 205515]|uniref:SAF domain-containing protein n=1 Tax=Gordonia sp. CPCC 205515 TaxID=3140791 RepID=UPI003AF3998B